MKHNGREVDLKRSVSQREARRQARASFVEPYGDLIEKVDAARAAGVYPFYDSLQPSRNSEAGGTGRPEVVFTANDYLGLSADARVREAAREAIARFGTSCCSSPLAGGYTCLHSDLESRLCAFLQQEAVATFASGYQANVGIISSLVGPGDLILTDLFNHASIIDGAKLSGANIRFFQHNSASHLDAILRRDGAGRRSLVIVEGIYSADGDIGRLPEICEVSHRRGALVMVDEAHSLGVLGEGGRGAAEYFGLLESIDLIMGTMSKSLASVGGFVAGDARLVDVVRHNARSLIFSAALPPANVAGVLAALEIVESDVQRRQRLWHNAGLLLKGLKRLGFNTMRSETPVIPVFVGDEPRAVEFAAALRDRGVLVCPAIPPMVQAHLSRVRAHVTALHEDWEINRALATIDSVARSLDIPREHPPVVQETNEAASPGRLRRVS